MRIKTGIWINAGILLIILLSFFTFSENFFPLLNSDMAVNILMTPSFSLPHDIYFWGQDRSGNLIPLIAHCFYEASGWQPVVVVSIVHYMILAAGFWALIRFVKTGYGRMILALVWFFPLWHFIEFLLILYGIQASCILIALNFFDRFTSTKIPWKRYSWLTASCMAFIVAVWVSDMALVSILALVVAGLLYFIAARKNPERSISWHLILMPAFVVLFWAVAAYLMLHYAKSVSTPVNTYHEGLLADRSSLKSGLKVVLDSVFKVFVFSSESSIESVFAWGLAGSLVFLIVSKKHGIKTWPEITGNPWFYFFFFDALLTLAAVLSSRWVAANGTGRRYFTTFFISAFISLILWLENMPKTSSKKTFRFVFATVVIIGSLSGSFRFYYPEIKPSRVRVLSALRYMGNIGIIAEYWNSYMTASPDPVHIKTTPCDKDYVRNQELVKEVFEQPKIYLIKDGWLSSFPDTIVQFGRTLRKKGSSFHLADAWLNRYELSEK